MSDPIAPVFYKKKPLNSFEEIFDPSTAVGVALGGLTAGAMAELQSKQLILAGLSLIGKC
ncbi:MAG: hypothetical protein MK052_11460 [Alphaproteobacteria bacterium]|nr:hypothetical protein [Alphaproteobacteria bacterium]